MRTPMPSPNNSLEDLESSPAAREPLLVLASQSPSRASILNASGIAFSTIVSGVDEDAALDRAERERGSSLGPAETAGVLARAKAEAVSELPEAAGHLILGCDSVFELDGVSYGKPYEPDVAISRIRQMSGRTGTLHTGHWLVDCRDVNQGSNESHGVVRSADVTFATMSDTEIREYVATEEPLDVAGSFTIEGFGAAFIASISGESHTVLGLSVHALRELLAKRGMNITQLWTRNT
ncbi:nucleoside triphosphate pyrophosphatase [uncultured Kocuria sp.]|uniref:Maf family protein n=1 Tax=uncultured Kocuria sp. TaxID=259305 RepID=UPI002593E0A1|nr:nucleoside triphosphate pyrophosphatase [uncultured Kocuria sp.]MCT1366545.1 Maf family nucleotide pyrophosphatase [Rothia sp. p3-SID1597]